MRKVHAYTFLTPGESLQEKFAVLVHAFVDPLCTTLLRTSVPVPMVGVQVFTFSGGPFSHAHLGPDQKKTGRSVG